jgi:hypothetical protein
MAQVIEHLSSNCEALEFMFRWNMTITSILLRRWRLENGQVEVQSGLCNKSLSFFFFSLC